jgi:acyl carrier protein
VNENEVITLTNKVFEESFEVPPEKLTPDAHIFSDLGLDSLDIVDLIVALQKAFKVQIRDDERVRNIRTLGDVHRYIALLQQERDAKAGPPAAS